MEPKECVYASCPNKDDGNKKLQLCSICRSQAYCSKECQKKVWVEGHKYCCAKPDVPRHSVNGNSIEDVQSTINQAQPGDIVVLHEGAYEWKGRGDKDKKLLQISKPVQIWGPTGGMDSVTLNCNLTIDDEVSRKGSITLANLSVNGSVKVESNCFESITFSAVRMEQSNPDKDGVMVHMMNYGTCLFFRCELIGGDEALYIDGIDDLGHSKEDNANKVHIKRSTIRNGAKRGICADDKFILEKSIIRDNGWYGIRSNLGWTDKGGNDWQRNPAKPNQTPTSGNGMFDGIAFPMGGGSMSRTGDTIFPGFGQFK